jgi:tRNA(His) 5'-end guanylyltransferase
VEEGLNAAGAMEELRGMRENEIHELVYQRGINLAKTPIWEKRGVMVYRKDGHVVHDWELPLFRSEDGLRSLMDIIKSENLISKK